jgi:predicted aspartyl protease
VTLSPGGGTFHVPVIINGAIRLPFIIDSGASDVTIPDDVMLTLIRTGTISHNDLLGKQSYTLADGSTVSSSRFRIRSLKVGDRVLENVIAGTTPVSGSLLLGQSFLGRFRSWSIDNGRGVLVLD